MKSILIATLILFTPLTLHSYPTPVDFDGKLLRWDISPDKPQVYFQVKTSDNQNLEILENITNDAADLWNNVETAFIELQKADEENPAQITLEFADVIDSNEFSSGYAQFDQFDGDRPKHCSIKIKLFGFSSNIEKTVLHELGHCIGLGHSLIPESIMSYEVDTNQFHLDIDDKAAISRLYPIDGDDPELPLGCSIAATHRSNTFFSILLLLSPFINFVLLRQKPRKCL